MTTSGEANPSLQPEPAGAACRPNISPAGKQRRRRVGYVALVASILLFVALIAVHASWYWRLLVFLPSSLTAVAFLQVSRQTCIARAAEGTFEHDDFSKTKAPDDEVAASRHVAAGIRRDSTLIGIASALLAVATAWLA
jgi:hypothetical protein